MHYNNKKNIGINLEYLLVKTTENVQEHKLATLVLIKNHVFQKYTTNTRNTGLLLGLIGDLVGTQVQAT